MKFLAFIPRTTSGHHILAASVWDVLEQIFPILDPCGSAAVKVLLQHVPGGCDSLVVSHLVVVQGSLAVLGDPCSHIVHVNEGEDDTGDFCDDHEDHHEGVEVEEEGAASSGATASHEGDQEYSAAQGDEQEGRRDIVDEVEGLFVREL